MIANLKANYPQEVVVIMQNVDALLEHTGYEYALHLHGFLPAVHCKSCKAIKPYKALCELCGRIVVA